MKTFARIVLAVVLVAMLSAFVGYHWWQQPGPGTTTIKLTGTAGDSFSGFYVQDGKRVVVNGALPWKVSETGISEAEFRKAKADEPLKLEARHFKAHGFDARVSGPVKAEFAGMRIRVHHAGIGMEPIR
jgi:hypothetical protein